MVELLSVMGWIDNEDEVVRTWILGEKIVLRATAFTEEMEKEKKEKREDEEEEEKVVILYLKGSMKYQVVIGYFYGVTVAR